MDGLNDVSTDQYFSLTTRIERSAEAVFAWHERPGALERLCPPWERIRIQASTNGLQNGAIVTVRTKVGPRWMDWKVEHRDYVLSRQFRDVQIHGPFAQWEHVHRFEPDDDGACLLTDEIRYRLPGGVVGHAIGNGYIRSKLERLFAWRHATTKADLESGIDRREMVIPRRIAIAGSSGLIGDALSPFLLTQGHDVIRLVRRPATEADEVYWNPESGELDSAALEGVDAIINLSGENVGGGRWTTARRDAILRSRTDATRTLVETIQRMQRRPEVFVSASAVGFYGDRGDVVLSEREGAGEGFLADVCQAWETHAKVAREAEVRTVVARLGVVLTPAGGALAKMLPVFKAGVGGPVGGGDQWMSWVTIDDAMGGIHHALINPRIDGPINIVAPAPVTNREFTRALARVLGRPAVFPVPAVVLRAILGEMAQGTLLASGRAVPERLIADGYRFRHPEVEIALKHVLGRP